MERCDGFIGEIAYKSPYGFVLDPVACRWKIGERSGASDLGTGVSSSSLACQTGCWDG